MNAEWTVPDDVYVDTDVVVNAVVTGMEHSPASLRFCARLIQQESRIYFSQVLRLEFSQAISRLPTRAQLPVDLRQAFELDNWLVDPQVREHWMLFGVQQLDLFLNQFNEVVELPIRRSIWESSVLLMARHQLRSHDAIHAATALHFGIPTIATCDEHFRRLVGVQVEVIRASSLDLHS